jgi:hypothetical protein
LPAHLAPYMAVHGRLLRRPDQGGPDLR